MLEKCLLAISWCVLLCGIQTHPLFRTTAMHVSNTYKLISLLTGISKTLVLALELIMSSRLVLLT